MGVFSQAKTPVTGVIQLDNGYYQAWYKGHCVAYHMQRYYCMEVLTLYRTGACKI